MKTIKCLTAVLVAIAIAFSLPAFAFAERSLVYGDVNNDTVVNSKDTLLIRKYNAKMKVTINMDAADVDFNGVINAKDTLKIRKFNAKIIKSFTAPEQSAVKKMISTMDDIGFLFNKLMNGPEDVPVETMLDMFVYEQGYHGYNSQIYGNMIDPENTTLVDETMKAAGWTKVGEGYHPNFTAEQVYKISVKREVVDEWMENHFGSSYSFTPDEVMSMIVTANNVLDVPNAVYFEKTDCVDFVTYGVGFGGFDIWHDHCGYDGNGRMVNDTELVFDYTYYTTNKPEDTTGLKSFPIYVMKEMHEFGLDAYTLEREDPSDIELTVWEVPARLTFRFNKRAFEFVSLVKE